MSDDTDRVAIAVATTVVKALKAHNEHITRSAVAISALVQALVDEHPALAERYEHYRLGPPATAAPIVATSREIADQLDALLQILAALEQPSS